MAELASFQTEINIENNYIKFLINGKNFYILN